EAQLATGEASPDEAAVASAKAALMQAAVMPLASNPTLRDRLVDVQRTFEQIIDEISIDEITTAEFVVDAKARAARTVESFRDFLDEHKDEITALQVLYSKPYAQRLTYRDVKELAE